MRLKWRLIGAMVALLVVLTATIAWVSTYAARLYFQEVNQKLNASVAMYVVDRLPLIQSGEVNKEALHTLAERAMTVNPSVEVYLLDPQGNIADHVLPKAEMALQKVDMVPVREFLAGNGDRLVLGEDPRGADHKAFTAAEIRHNNELQGYLYVILGGARFDEASNAFLGTFIGRITVAGLLVVMLFGGLLGAHLLLRLSRPIEKLQSAVGQYVDSGFTDHNLLEEVPQGSYEVAELKQGLMQLATQLEAQLKQLEATDHLRRELFANVSHDLRTPLASMQGYIETLLIKHSTLTDAERREYLNTALQHSHRLNRLIVDLFELAKLDSGVMEPRLEHFSLAELLHDLVQEFGLEAENRGISLQLELAEAEQPHMVQGDIRLLERVFQNLLANALRYTPPGGEVAVRLAASELRVGVEVADSGTGIDQALLPNLFDRYAGSSSNRAETDFHGSGLGLAIVKRILDMHGSTIEVRTQTNEGTRFTFDLPVQAQAA